MDEQQAKKLAKKKNAEKTFWTYEAVKDRSVPGGYVVIRKQKGSTGHVEVYRKVPNA